MTSFDITLYGQCCRRHLVGQRIVSDISVVRGEVLLCSESNNTNLLLRLRFAVPGTSSLLNTPNTTCPTRWRRVVGDHRYTLVSINTAP